MTVQALTVLFFCSPFQLRSISVFTEGKPVAWTGICVYHPVLHQASTMALGFFPREAPVTKVQNALYKFRGQILTRKAPTDKWQQEAQCSKVRYARLGRYVG